MKFLKNIWQKYNNLNIKQFKKFYIIAIAIIFLLNTIIFSFLIADIVAQPDIEAIEPDNSNKNLRYKRRGYFGIFYRTESFSKL